MCWKLPPRIKIYEALGAVADGRVVVHGHHATVRSSSGNKEYQVEYRPEYNSISSNDNASYWRGYLGYPSIALMAVLDVVAYDPIVLSYLKGIPWKDLNVKNGNNYVLTEQAVKERARGLSNF